MATQPNDQYDDEPLELTEDQEVGEDGADDGADDDDQTQSDDFAFTDDDPEPEETPSWAKHLRQEQARLTRENRELRQAAASRQTEEAAIVVGDKPTEESWDFNKYQSFGDALEDWYDTKQRAADQQKKRDDAQRKGQEEWAKIQRRYDDEKAGISVVGRDEAEATALSSLSREQAAVIAKHADSPARFIIALGKNPTKLQQIASIEDPFALTKAMTKMEATLGKPKGPRPPEPERRVQGKPITAGGADKKLAELEKKAEQTGDRSAIIAYKRSLKEKAK